MDLKELRKIKLDANPYPIEEYSAHDEYGDYLTGTFLYGSVIVIVSHENELWHLSIKAKNPIGLYQMNKLRYLFIPNDVKMAYRLPQRHMKNNDPTRISLWETRE